MSRIRLVLLLTIGPMASVAAAQDERPRLVAQLGHSGGLRRAIFHPDGRHVLTGGMEGLVILWEIDSGREVRRFESEGSRVTSLDISKDGAVLLAELADGRTKRPEAILWDVRTGKVLRRFMVVGNPFIPEVIGLSPDGRFLAMVGRTERDSRLGIWDARSGDLVRTLRTIGGVRAISTWSGFAYSPDGRWIAAHSGDDIRIWDAARARLVHQFPGAQSSPVMMPCASFTAAGERVVTCRSGQAVLWDLATGHELKRFAHDGLFAAEISPDGKYVATLDEISGLLRVWDVGTGKERWRSGVARLRHPNVDFAPDGRRLLTVSGDQREGLEVVLRDVATGSELQRLGGPMSPVRRARFADGNRLAISTGAAHESKMHVWDCLEGSLVRTHESTTDKAHRLWLSPGGHHLFEVESTSFRVRDLATGVVLRSEESEEVEGTEIVRSPAGRIVARLRPEPAMVQPWAAEVAPTGRLLVYTLRRAAFVWDLESARQLGRIGIAGEWTRAAMSFEGDRLYLGQLPPDGSGSDLTEPVVSAWDIDAMRELWTRELPAECVGGGLAAATREEDRKVVVVHDLATGKEVARLSHDSESHPLALSDDGNRLITGSSTAFSTPPGPQVWVWDLDTAQVLHRLNGHRSFIRLAAFSPDGRYMFTGDSGGDGRIWDAASGRETARLGRLAQKAGAFSHDGKRIAAVTRSGSLQVWNARTGQQLLRLGRQPGTVLALAFRPNGDLLALTGIGLGRLWDVDGKVTRVYRVTGNTRNRFASIALSQDRRLVLTGSRNASPVLWDASTGTEIRRFDAHCRGVRCVAFAPDEVTAASGSEEGTVIVWDVATGRRLQSFIALRGVKATPRNPRQLEQGCVNAVVFGPDGATVAAGSNDGSVFVWDLASRQILLDCKGHVGEVNSLEFSPDGQMLLSGGADGTSRLWSTATGAELCRLIAFDDGSWAVVDPVGRYDASNGGDVEGLHWVIENEPISLDQLKERYYEPGLLAKILGFNKEPLREVKAFTAPKLHPSFELDEPTAERPTLGIRLRNRGGGIGRVVVKINGKELTADARGSEVDAEAQELSLEVPLAGDPRLRPGEYNTIEIQAFNAEGYLRSRGVTLDYVAPGAAGEETPALWAIVCGTGSYAGEGIRLRYATKDAEDFATALEAAAPGLFAERVHVQRLIDPKRSELVKALGDAREAKPDDVLVLYLAGHGVSREDFYYLTREARSTKLEDPALRETTALSSAELTELLKQVPALKQVLILDTCASGGFVEKLTESRQMSSDHKRALERLQDRTGIHVLAGCAADRVSYEASRFGQGLLTYSLLMGMRGAALRKDEYVDVSKLFQYAADRVPDLAGELGGLQRPVIASPRGGSSFDIGRLGEEDKAKVPLRSVRPMVLRSLFQDEEELDDVLELAKRVDRRLNEVAARGAEARLVFLDAREYPDAYRVAGRYRVEGDAVTVDIRLSRGKEKLARFAVEGKRGDLGAVAASIVTEVERRLR